MKKSRPIALIVTLLTGLGIGIFNFTGTDIKLEDGTEYVSHDLTKSLTKEYQDRSIEDSLTIYIHHTAGPKNQSLENIAKYHVNKQKWPAIAYHVSVDSKGNISMLNEIEKKSYHNSKDNTRGIGIVAIGNYETEEPSEEMVESIIALTDAMCMTLKIKAIKGHRDSKATACPGEFLYKRMQKEGLIDYK